MSRVVCALLLASVLFEQDNSEKPKPATIEGVITKVGTGEPIVDVRVTATPESGGMPKTATTSLLGRFTITDLAPGRYKVDAARTLFVRTRRNSPVLTVTLTSGQNLRDVNIQLQPAAVITGRITDESRQPLRAVRVEALRYQYRDATRVLVAAAQATSDDRGEYRIFNLEPDVYYVRASPPANIFGPAQPAFAAIYYPNVVDSRDAVSITTTSGTDTGAIDISINAVPTYSVRLRVVGSLPQNPPPNSTFVVLRRDRGNVDLQTVQTESLGDGVYKLSRLLPGAYDIFAQLRTPAAQGGMVQTGRVSVSITKEDIDGGTVAVRPAGRLTGRVVTSEPLTVAFDPTRLTINLRPMDGLPGGLGATSRIAGGSMSPEGDFVIPNAANGRFRVEVTGLGTDVHLESARYAGANVLDTGITIDGDPQGSLDLFVAGPGSVGGIEGIVRQKDDQPVPNTTVVVIPAPNRRENPTAFKTATTDQNGHFSVRGLLPGTYSILAWEDIEPGAYLNPEFLKPFEPRATKVTVERGGRHVVNVLLISESQ